MAIDSIARAMAASGGGGGEGSIEDIISGDGITVTGGSTKTITNNGVRSVKASMKDGAISVNTGGTSQDVVINGLVGKRSSTGSESGEIFNTALIAGSNAHAEGNATRAGGTNSHAEGNHTEASGSNTHAGGLYTVASGDNQTVIGKYNTVDRNKAFIIGGGSSTSDKKNIATVDWNGNVFLDGTVTAKDADGNEVILNGIDAYTKDEVDKKINKTTIETVTSDANVITVPENVKDFGMISMVGGKTVKTKNLIPFPYYSESDTEPVNGIKRVINPDGTITFSGTSTSNTTNFFCAYSLSLKAGTYTLSGCPDLSGLQIRMKVGSTNYDINANETKTITLDSDETGVQIYPRVTKADVVCNNVIFKPMLEEDSEATAYEPYFEGLHNAPVKKIVSTNVIKSDFGALTKVSGRYGYDFNNLKSGEYEVTITNSSSKALSVDIYHNGAFSGNAKIVNANETKTEVFNVADGDSIVVYCGSGVTTNPISFISVSVGGKPFVKEISLSDLLNLPDYGCSAGDVYNYIDFEEMKYHHRVGSVDMGTLTWAYSTVSNRFWVETPYIKHEPNYTFIANIINADYTTMSDNMATSTDMSISVNGTARLIIKDLAKGTDAIEFKTAMSGKILNYERAEEEIIDLKPFLSIIPVEANGTIEFVNEYNLPVPNTVKYQKGAE